MATGILGQASGLSSLTYTPGTNAKVAIVSNFNGSYPISINGAIISGLTGYQQFTFWVGAGQTVVIAGTSASTPSFFVSTLES